MFIVFFTIVFIAELIILAQLICIINNARRVVCNANKKVLDYQFIIREKCYKARLYINKLLLALEGVSEKVTKKQKLLNKLFSWEIIPILITIISQIGFNNIVNTINTFITIKGFLKILKRK